MSPAGGGLDVLSATSQRKAGSVRGHGTAVVQPEAGARVGAMSRLMDKCPRGLTPAAEPRPARVAVRPLSAAASRWHCAWANACLVPTRTAST